MEKQSGHLTLIASGFSYVMSYFDAHAAGISALASVLFLISHLVFKIADRFKKDDGDESLS